MRRKIRNAENLNNGLKPFKFPKSPPNLFEKQPDTLPEKVFAYWKTQVETQIGSPPKLECLVTFVLDAGGKIADHYFVCIGDSDVFPTNTVRLFRKAVIAEASYIVLVHNHKNGDTEPSKDDIQFTNNVLSRSDLLGIHLVDHIIVGHEGVTSIRERGCLPHWGQ